MISYSEQEIISLILNEYQQQTLTILAPIIKSRKGHYRELFDQLIKQGFSKVFIDGELKSLSLGFRLDRYKTHDISLVVDRISVQEKNKQRLKESVNLALKKGKNELIIIDETDQLRTLSKSLMCPDSGISLPEPEPNLFSFNSPKGACEKCNGLGYNHEIEQEKNNSK